MTAVLAYPAFVVFVSLVTFSPTVRTFQAVAFPLFFEVLFARFLAIESCVEFQ